VIHFHWLVCVLGAMLEENKQGDKKMSQHDGIFPSMRRRKHGFSKTFE